MDVRVGLLKKAEHWRIDAFELRWWRRRLRVPWTARRTNQSTLKEISPECSLEGLTLKLKLQLQCFGHLMWRTDSFEKTLMLGKSDWTELNWTALLAASRSYSLVLVDNVSHRGGFPCCQAWALSTHFFSNCNTQAWELQLRSSGVWAQLVVVLGLSCSAACGNLPRPGIEPLSPTLAGSDFYLLRHQGSPSLLKLWSLSPHLRSTCQHLAGPYGPEPTSRRALSVISGVTSCVWALREHSPVQPGGHYQNGFGKV